jgi:hypothetical protein
LELSLLLQGSLPIKASDEPDIPGLPNTELHLRREEATKIQMLHAHQK